MPDCEPDNQFAMIIGQRTPRHDQTAIRHASEFSNGTLDLARFAQADRTEFYPERGRRGLDGGQLTDFGGIGGIPKHRYSRHRGCDLL